MWFNLLGMAIKTGAEVYANNQRTKKAISDAKLQTAIRMAKGEIEYQGAILENQKSDWKDEFVLLTISSPLFLLAYSVFADDPEMERKLDMYFEKLQDMPWWLIGLWVSVVAAIYGLKATDIINVNKGK